MFANLLTVRNMVILVALALAALGGNVAQEVHLWKTKAADSAKYDLLVSTNRENDKVANEIASKLAECVGKQTASDQIARDAIQARDDTQAKLQSALNKLNTKRRQVYETPDCKKLMDTGVCPAISNGLLGRGSG